MGKRSEVLAARLEQGVRELTALARTLTDEQWKTKIPHDGRTVGVVVHHVGTMYPVEIELAQKLGAGQAVEGVTWDAVHEINAQHSRDFAGTTKQEAIELLRKNSAAAAAGIRALSDEQLDQAAPVSLNSDAPLTCQFFLEDHPVRHSYHHLAAIRRALELVEQTA